ncbi:MAG: hypothetical protein DRI65_15355 [Chloroflexota bacterium]|nr:MAG: hypothetical protein DRI65_15355 [Chloroflexota bacterium]
MIEITYPTSEAAWIGLNKALVKIDEQPYKDKAKIYSSQVILYDVLIHIKRSYIPEDWDFTRTVNYRKAKWNGLKSNYVDKTHLEQVLASVKHRELKKTKNYNESMLFGNSHSHGKGCLLVCTFSRRHTDETPVLNVVMRASEIFKRGLLDFGLVHRIGEEAYGDQPFAVNIFAQQLWMGADWGSLLYVIDKPWFKELKGSNGFAGKVYEWYEKFRDQEEIMNMNYHAHRRACKVIQGITATPPLLARDCNLY